MPCIANLLTCQQLADGMPYPAPVSVPSSGPALNATEPNDADGTDLDPELLPFLRWPGGKRWLIASYSKLIPHRYKRYIEPFLGAGAVFFHLRPKRAILGDLNEDVITAYAGIKDDWASVQILLERHHLAHCEDYYYEMREIIPESLAAQAARIIYLNRTCFNGIYRVNKLGKFNVPVGDRTNVVLDIDNFSAIAGLLGRADLNHGDFEALVDRAEASDLVFLDPPYTVRHNQNGFIKYNETLFSWDDQERLAKAATRAAERGARVVATNAAHTTVRRLYNGDLFTFQTVNRFSAISATPDNRRQFDELVITSKRRRTSHGSS